MSATWERTIADHRATTRHRIIEGGMASLREQGLTGTTMTAIAERAGISRPTLYKHFPDVDHIMAAIVTEQFAHLRARLDAELEADWPAIRKVEYLVRLHVRAYASEPDRMGQGSLEAGMSPVVHDAVRRELADHHALIVTILREGEADGSFRSDIDLDLHAEVFQHVLGGLRHTVHRTDRDLDVLADEVSRLLRHGLQGPAARASDEQ